MPAGPLKGYRQASAYIQSKDKQDRKIKDWMSRGLPHHFVDGQVYFFARDIDEFIKSNGTQQDSLELQAKKVLETMEGIE